MPGLPADLDHVAAKALARDPRARYATAAAFAGDLRRVLSGQPVLARRSPVAGRRPALRRWLAAGALVLVAAYLSGFLSSPPPPSPAAPYAALHWVAEQPEVEIGNEWVRLLAIDGTPVADLVAFCKERYGPLWRKRFGEDLPRVMADRGRRVGSRVGLRVERLEGGEPWDLQDVPMTAENGRAIWKAGIVGVDAEVVSAQRLAADFRPDAALPTVAPFVAARVAAGRLEVRLDDEAPFRPWLAIDGRDVGELRRICQRAFGSQWRKRIGEDLAQVLALLGTPPGERVELVLGRDDGGRDTVVAAMTEANRWRVVRGNR